MPCTLYMLDGSPPARSAWMACEAVGLEVETYKMDFPNKEQYSDWFLKLNPRHCVPTLDDDGFVLWESRAILRYVADAYSKGSDLYPTDARRRATIDRALDYDLGTLFKHISNFIYPQIFLGKPAPDTTDLDRELTFLDQTSPISEGHFMTGEHMTIADIASIASVTFLETVAFDLSTYPHVVTWVDKMKDQPFFTKCNAGFQEFKQFLKTDAWQKITEHRRKAELKE